MFFHIVIPLADADLRLITQFFPVALQLVRRPANDSVNI